MITGSSELCTLADPRNGVKEWVPGYLLSKSRLCLWSRFAINSRESGGGNARVIDEHGYSLLAKPANAFLYGISAGRFLCGTGKSVYRRADAQTSYLSTLLYLKSKYCAVIGLVHLRNGASPRGAGKEGFRYRYYIDIFDGGRRWSVILTACGPFVKPTGGSRGSASSALATIRHVWSP